MSRVLLAVGGEEFPVGLGRGRARRRGIRRFGTTEAPGPRPFHGGSGRNGRGGGEPGLGGGGDQPSDEARGKEGLIQRSDHRPEDVPLGGQRPVPTWRDESIPAGRRVLDACTASPRSSGAISRWAWPSTAITGARPAAMSVSAAARIRVRPEPSGWGRRALVRRIRFDSPAARRIPAAAAGRSPVVASGSVGGMAEGPER